MKISEAIKLLQEIKKKHGDLPIYISHEWESPLYQNEISGIHYAPTYESPIFKADKFPERAEITA